MSNRGYQYQSAQARAGAEQYTNGLSHQLSHDEVKRTNSAASQRSRQLPPINHSPTSRAPAGLAQVPVKQPSQQGSDYGSERGQKRSRNKSPVDWISFFGGKPPAEIITIHDDDSPAPPATTQRLPGPAEDDITPHHVGKKRRTNAAGGEPAYSATNTPYSQSNGASTESLQNTTAPTSLGSQISTSSKLEGARAGEKRKRNPTRNSDQDRKKQETSKTGAKGYLAQYGDYVPPPKQYKKQKEVHVPAIHDVSSLRDFFKHLLISTIAA